MRSVFKVCSDLWNALPGYLFPWLSLGNYLACGLVFILIESPFNYLPPKFSLFLRARLGLNFPTLCLQ